MNIGIGDQSVVVLTTPRTGSTALCRRLSDENGLVYYNEAFHPDYDISDRFWKDFDAGIKTICKVFPEHVISDEQLSMICDKSFVIFLERDNLVEQIASYHSLGVTNKPWFAKNEIGKPYEVSLDNTHISFSIRQIIKLRQSAEVYRSMADISLKYEDIVDLIENEHIRKYDRPENYEELLVKIKKLLPIFTSPHALQRNGT